MDGFVSVDINELLQVRVLDDSLTYLSRVDDLVDGRIVISWPTNAGVRVLIRERQPLSLSFVRPDASYLFKAVVEQRRQLPIPQLILKPTGAAERMQRRQYFRVKASMSVELNGSGIDTDAAHEEFCLHTRTHDVSGSGISIHHGSPIPAGAVLEIKLILPGELPAIKAVCKVAHSSAIAPPAKAMFHVGMYFVTISEHDRSRIIRHLFRIQQSLLA